MPYRNLEDGLYLLKQQSPDKGVEHYGVLDVGNRLMLPRVAGTHPIVIHQTPPRVRSSWLRDTGNWLILGRIEDEQAALERLRIALANPTYNLFGNNCEHFARFIATGRRESTQIRSALFVGGLVAATVAALRQ